MHKIYYLVNKLFILTLKQTGVINSEVTWSQHFTSEYKEQTKTKPVYYKGKQTKGKSV